MDSPPRFSAQDVLDHLPSGEAGTPSSGSAAPRPLPEASPAAQPQLSAGDLLEQLRGQFEQLCEGVARAVNGAPAGQVINASEEKVRDLLADFRLATYQAAIQLRLEAAQAAFPPSTEPDDGQTPAEQGP
jgi:hypothetical protein